MQPGLLLSIIFSAEPHPVLRRPTETRSACRSRQFSSEPVRLIINGNYRLPVDLHQEQALAELTAVCMKTDLGTGMSFQVSHRFRRSTCLIHPLAPRQLPSM